MSGNSPAALLLWPDHGGRQEMMVVLRFLAFSLLAGVVTETAAQQVFVSDFEVAGLSCDRCAATATDALRKVPGVLKARVTFATRRAVIESSRPIGDGELRAALAQFGFEARFPNDPAVKPLSADERARLDIRIASRGETFDIRKHLAHGKFTIFDFWAKWCGPCHVLTPKIEHLVQQQPNVALRTVDVGSWDSPAGRQVTREFKAAALPYVRVYGPDGAFVGEVTGNDIGKIKALVGTAD